MTIEEKLGKKYTHEQAPDWVEHYTAAQLLEISQDDQKTTEIKNSGKGVSFLNNEIVRTDNGKNHVYYLKVWSLSNSDILQSVTVSEILARENEYVAIHRVAVLREGALIDKHGDLNVRVLDDEQSSSRGMINKNKKIHFVIKDLRLGDVFVLEYSVIANFTDKNYLDKEYFRYVRTTPNGYWFYKRDLFKVINARKEKLQVIKKYARDNDNNITEEQPEVVEVGKEFVSENLNLQLEYRDDIIMPYLEVTTPASWKDISSFQFEAFKHLLSFSGLKDHPVYKTLGLGDSIDIEEKIQKIIEYVQNEIVYLFDAEVMHGQIPQESAVTLESKSGDCKAKSLLLINLLNTLQVKSELVHVNYGADYMLKICSPSPFLFNHTIVRIVLNGKKYFVDATWNNRAGVLGKRAEPIIFNYLVIEKGAGLSMLEELPVEGLNSEKTIEITLKGDGGNIRMETIFSRESADNVRNNFKQLGINQYIKLENEMISVALQYTDEKDMEDHLHDARYKIVSDDLKNNRIVALYEVNIVKPYLLSNGNKVFRFYPQFDHSTITNYKQKDVPSISFCSFPFKYHLKIHSDLFVHKGDATTKKETEIDNKYFSFKNKKSFSLKEINVTSEYIPKTYTRIKTEDFQKIKSDYIKITDSNIGVGAIFLPTSTWVYKHWYLPALGFYLAIQLLRFFAGAN